MLCTLPHCILSFAVCRWCSLSFFFFNDTATTEIYTLSLHDALPILLDRISMPPKIGAMAVPSEFSACARVRRLELVCSRSEEHTSELQSQSNLVCRLLLEKKKTAPHLRATAGRYRRPSEVPPIPTGP